MGSINKFLKTVEYSFSKFFVCDIFRYANVDKKEPKIIRNYYLLIHPDKSVLSNSSFYYILLVWLQVTLRYIFLKFVTYPIMSMSVISVKSWIFFCCCFKWTFQKVCFARQFCACFSLRHCKISFFFFKFLINSLSSVEVLERRHFFSLHKISEINHSFLMPGNGSFNSCFGHVELVPFVWNLCVYKRINIMFFHLEPFVVIIFLSHFDNVLTSPAVFLLLHCFTTNSSGMSLPQ